LMASNRSSGQVRAARPVLPLRRRSGSDFAPYAVGPVGIDPDYPILPRRPARHPVRP
jgi:hypothetical protein